MATLLTTISFTYSQEASISLDTFPYHIYPQVNDHQPVLSSPGMFRDGNEYVVARTHDEQYAIIPVTLRNKGGICPQLIVDTLDFPHLAKTGLHSDKQLDSIRTITGRSLGEITRLGRPEGLSQAGFMAEDENIISVLKGDNQLVKRLGLTHPQLAKPLFHVLNMMDMDLKLDRWNMARHQWANITHFYYNDQIVHVTAEDTKGGQKSIFNDGIEGGFFIKLWRELKQEEILHLKKHYNHLNEDQFQEMVDRLSSINTGEIQPQYIMRYGFYEGHTYWRADPIALSFIFGIKTLDELDRRLKGNLYQALLKHYTPENRVQ